MNLEDIKKRFSGPPAEFRSAPFWGWNYAPEKVELKRQVKDMKDHGMGGFFMHSREGLEIDYLGREWMDCVKEAVQAAREEGVSAWIYDEDRWPSGVAGGLVPAKGDACRSKAITIEVSCGSYDQDEKVLAIFKIKAEGERLLECTRINGNEDAELKQGECLLIFRREVSGPRPWFNNEAPPDNLSHEAVRTFLEVTYEAYKKEVGDDFGKTVPGIFTDEPHIAERQSLYPDDRGWIPYTDEFEGYFQEKRGYSIFDILPYIFYEGEQSTKARHDYWRTVSEKFSEAYTKQLADWCTENSLRLTGHYISESSLGMSIRLGGSVMPQLRHLHMPGVDLLCEQANEYMTLKQCSSVANQYGRKRMISEIYAAAGYSFTFEAQKWTTDWQFVLGVNLRCQSVAMYTIKGCAKRDYPPIFSYNSNWWDFNPVVEDYYARLSSVLIEGQVQRDVLVIHPVTSGWTMLGAGTKRKSMVFEDEHTERVDAYGRKIDYFIRYLLGAHYDFDFGDETIMEETARVEGDKIYVNKAGYRVIIVPGLVSLLKSTVRLLKEFMDHGGRVIVIEPAPVLVEGEAFNEVDRLFGHQNIIKVANGKAAVRVLEDILPRKVSLVDKNLEEVQDLLYMLRDNGDYNTLFIVNTDRNRSHQVKVELSFTGMLEEWDPLTGKIREMGCIPTGKGICFTANLGPAGSKLYMIRKNKEQAGSRLHPLPFDFWKSEEPGMLHTVLGSAAGFTRTLPNALVLDMCSYRVGDGPQSEVMEVWKAQKEIREKLGMRQIVQNELPQRYLWAHDTYPADHTPVELKFIFNATYVPENDVYIVVEDADRYDLRFNGGYIELGTEEHFMDIAFNKIKLGKLHSGQNELVLTCTYTGRYELENIYLLGDFAVDMQRNIVREPERLYAGDWCLQGYPHYCGSMLYHFNYEYQAENVSGEKIILELGDFKAVTAAVHLNGRLIAPIPWRADNKVDITEGLIAGMNRIDIEIVGSMRNFIGPFHNVYMPDGWIDWAPFRREGKQYTTDYNLYPYGLMGQIRIYKKQD
jgi:hypothetical protein